MTSLQSTRLVVLSALLALSACGDPKGSSHADAATLRRLVTSVYEPGSSFRRLDDELRRIGAECVSGAGFPGWEPEVPEYAGRGLALPSLADSGDSYESRLTPRPPAQEGDFELSAFESGAIEAYLGSETNPQESVTAEVPGFGTIGYVPGGCLGSAYEEVFSADAEEWRISSMVLMNVASGVRRSAEARDDVSEGLGHWVDCMRSKGIISTDPYEASVAEPPAASADSACRESSDYESIWDRAIDEELTNLDSDLQRRFSDFERMSSEAMRRLGGG